MKLCGGIDLHSNNSVLVLIQPAHCGVVRDRGRLQVLAVGVWPWSGERIRCNAIMKDLTLYLWCTT